MPFLSQEIPVTEIGWIYGIVFSILASIIGGASKLAIRKSWLIEQAWRDSQPRLLETIQNEEPDERDNLLVVSRDDKRVRIKALSLRLSGMIGMSFLNPLFCVLAMNYASPSILAPFSGLTLVWIVLFAGCLINEHPTKPQICAAALIICGEIIIAFGGDHTNDEGKSVHDVLQSYRDPLFLCYIGLMILWMLFLFACIRYYSKYKWLQRFAWGVSGGSLTGLQNFLKDALTILKAEHSAGTWTWLPIFVLLAILTAFTGLLLLTATMKRYDATYSAAMFVGSFVISASLMSVVHYQTFKNLSSVLNYVLYPTGLLVLMAGVSILVHYTKEPNATSNDAVSVELSLTSEEFRTRLPRGGETVQQLDLEQPDVVSPRRKDSEMPPSTTS